MDIFLKILGILVTISVTIWLLKVFGRISIITSDQEVKRHP